MDIWTSCDTFKRRSGAAFAGAVVAAMGLELSQMALGTGATIMGLGLSYSIHMVTHGLHVGSVRQLIGEMAWPMTVGSITTIGAFLSLLFTGSTVLRHLGLFASLTLIGTLLFCLTFLKKDQGNGNPEVLAEVC